MISKYSHKGLTWIDLKSPSEEEISHVIEQHSIPAHIQEEIQINTKEDKINIENDFIFARLNISHHNKTSKIIFIVNDDFVLTIHDNPIISFDKFGKEMELDIIVEEKSKIKTNKLLFAYLLKNLYLNSETQLIASNEKIENLEKKLLQKNKKLKLLMLLFILYFIVIMLIVCL